MSNTQQPKAVQKMQSETIAVAVQECHKQLCEQRNKVLNLAELFHRTSAAYYTMCDMSGPLLPDGSDLMLAMAEFHRRGLLHFDTGAVNQLSSDYVQALKMLKQAVDNAVGICDRLAVLTNAQRATQQPPVVVTPTPVHPVTTLPPATYPSLDEALEAELNEETQ